MVTVIREYTLVGVTDLRAENKALGVCDKCAKTKLRFVHTLQDRLSGDDRARDGYPQQPLVNEMKLLADDAEKTRNELAEIEEELHTIEAKRPEAIRKRAVAEMQREVADELNEIRMEAKAITIE